MPKCKSCGKKIRWYAVFRNPLLLRNWKVLNSSLFETLCLECVASWNSYFEGVKKLRSKSPSKFWIDGYAEDNRMGLLPGRAGLSGLVFSDVN